MYRPVWQSHIIVGKNSRLRARSRLHVKFTETEVYGVHFRRDKDCKNSSPFFHVVPYISNKKVKKIYPTVICYQNKLSL